MLRTGLPSMPASRVPGLEAVGPRSHRRGDAPFQGVRVDTGFIAGSDPRDDVNAGEVRLRDLHLRFHAERGKRLADDFFDALTDLCVVFFARHEHQAGIESVKRIAPEQHANPRTLLQSEYARDDTIQLGNTCLE